MRGSLWHAYRADPLSAEGGREAHLDAVKLTMPTGLIGVGRRQVYRLLDAFQARGPDGLISRERGRPVFGSLDQEVTPVAGHFNCGHSPPRAKTSRLPTWLAAVTMPSASIRSIIRAARL